jgi:hypothetical protein
MQGVLVEIDDVSGKAVSITAVREDVSVEIPPQTSK